MRVTVFAVKTRVVGPPASSVRLSLVTFIETSSGDDRCSACVVLLMLLFVFVANVFFPGSGCWPEAQPQTFIIETAWGLSQGEGLQTDYPSYTVVRFQSRTLGHGFNCREPRPGR